MIIRTFSPCTSQCSDAFKHSEYQHWKHQPCGHYTAYMWKEYIENVLYFFVVIYYSLYIPVEPCKKNSIIQLNIRDCHCQPAIPDCTSDNITKIGQVSLLTWNLSTEVHQSLHWSVLVGNRTIWWACEGSIKWLLKIDRLVDRRERWVDGQGQKQAYG